MAFLKLNGIEVQVLRDGAEQQNEEIGGDSERGPAGALISNNITFKQNWPFRVRHAIASKAIALRNLIRGDGDVWSFEAGHPAGFYSSRGTALVPTGAAPNVEIAAVAAQFGTKGLFIGSSYSASAAGLLTAIGGVWTLALWRTATHFVVRSDGAKWENGVRNDALSTATWLDTSGGTLKLWADGTDYGFDDVVLLPYLVPTDWPAQLYAAGAAFGDLPHHRATGDFIEGGASAKTVKGEAEGMEVTKASIGGTQQPIYVVRAKLIEV